jgi:hypothetical protein
MTYWLVKLQYIGKWVGNVNNYLISGFVPMVIFAR